MPMPRAGWPCAVSSTWVVSRPCSVIDPPAPSDIPRLSTQKWAGERGSADNFLPHGLKFAVRVGFGFSSADGALSMRYPRDLAGYGPNPPHAGWPGGANVAVQFVLNYEEGGENNLLHGDTASEAFLADVVGAAPWADKRHWNIESMYEYGGRAGFWRLHRLFTERKLPVTVYGVATALMRASEQLEAMQTAGWEIASHGYKWVEHKDMPIEEERAQIAEAVRLHTIATGSRPLGWYTGRCSINTVDLVSDEGGFAYISDTYDDDLPYLRVHNTRPQLIIPYTLSAND